MNQTPDFFKVFNVSVDDDSIFYQQYNQLINHGFKFNFDLKVQLDSIWDVFSYCFKTDIHKSNLRNEMTKFILCKEDNYHLQIMTNTGQLILNDLSFNYTKIEKLKEAKLKPNIFSYTIFIQKNSLIYEGVSVIFESENFIEQGKNDLDKKIKIFISLFLKQCDSENSTKNTLQKNFTLRQIFNDRQKFKNILDSSQTWLGTDPFLKTKLIQVLDFFSIKSHKDIPDVELLDLFCSINSTSLSTYTHISQLRFILDNLERNSTDFIQDLELRSESFLNEYIFIKQMIIDIATGKRAYDKDLVIRQSNLRNFYSPLTF